MVGKRNIKSVAFLSVLILVVTSMSGCLGSEQTVEDVFFEHIEASRKLILKGSPLHEQAIREENIIRATELLIDSKRLSEEAKTEVLLAKDSTDDLNKKEYAGYLAESLRYDILYHEKLIEASPYLKSGDDETAAKLIHEGEEYLEQRKYWQDEATKIKPQK